MTMALARARLLATTARRSAAARRRRRFGSLPSVDIGGLVAGASASRRREAQASLAAALLEEDSPGFFYAKNAPGELSPEYLDGVYDFVDAAHGLAPHVKFPFADPEQGSGELGAGQEKGAKIPTSKAHISVVFHSFWLTFGRVIISRNGLEA